MTYAFTKEDRLQEKNKILAQEIYGLFINNCNDINEFSWMTTCPISRYPRASTCFSKLSVLKVDLNFVTSADLLGMARICQSIEDLSIRHCGGDLTGLIALIDTQRNLQSLHFHTDRNDSLEDQWEELSKGVERKAATLKKFNIKSGEYSISPKIFPSLINLEYLKIWDGFSNTKEWEKYLSIASSPNLQYLKTSY